MLDWSGRKALVSGGRSFIGSHLAGALLKKGARVRVADKLSSGKQEHIQHWIDHGLVEFLQADPAQAARMVGQSWLQRGPGPDHSVAFQQSWQAGSWRKVAATPDPALMPGL